ncbi:hypothetical protein [Nonomuraea longicatena]
MMPARITVPLVALLVVAAVVVTWLITRDAAARPAAYKGEPTSAMYSLVDSRQRDPAPLTVAEVFPESGRRLGELTRAGTEEFADCAEVLSGVEAPGCTQALRATYTGASAAGQFVILNLADGKAADALVAALGKDGFVEQAAAFAAAGSRAQARALGHYVTVSWIGPLTEGAKPDLAAAHVALDGLSRVVQARVINAD